MVRFIYLGAQTFGWGENDPTEKEFCFWDTVHDKFIVFGNERVVFSSIEDFKKQYPIAESTSDNPIDKIERYLGLIPKGKVFETEDERDWAIEGYISNQES